MVHITLLAFLTRYKNWPWLDCKRKDIFILIYIHDTVYYKLYKEKRFVCGTSCGIKKGSV